MSLSFIIFTMSLSFIILIMSLSYLHDVFILHILYHIFMFHNLHLVYMMSLSYIIFTMSLSSACLYLQLVYIFTVSLSSACLYLQLVYISTVSLSPPCPHLAFGVSVRGGADLRRSGAPSQQAVHRRVKGRRRGGKAGMLNAKGGVLQNLHDDDLQEPSRCLKLLVESNQFSNLFQKYKNTILNTF